MEVRQRPPRRLIRASAYDPTKDFRPISLLTRTPFVLTVHPGSFAGRQFADVIDYARAHPGRLSYASIGPGTATHLAMEELKSQLGLDIVHVPYRGFPQATLDLVAGRCQLMFNVASAAAEHVAAGRLVAVAQTGAKRLSMLPKCRHCTNSTRLSNLFSVGRA